MLLKLKLACINFLDASQKNIRKHFFLKFLRFILVIFALIPLIFVARKPGTMKIVDADDKLSEAGFVFVNGSFRPIVANNPLEWIFLAIARGTAFAIYPDIFVIFISKCRATLTLFARIPYGMYLFQDMHDVHAYCGRFIANMVAVHTLFHLLRWGIAGNINLLIDSAAGVTGLIATIVTPLITVMMMVEPVRRRIQFEIRKAIHYLFFVFSISLIWHVPTTALPYGGFIRIVMIFCIVLYIVDAAIVQVFMTERVKSPTFAVSETGIQMTCEVSDSFQKRLQNGGYAYVCLPWIDKNQWHAFSLYEIPKKKNTTCVFMAKAGDWTKGVHNALQRDTARPVWFCGPFPSPYNNADLYDNQILIASGIGITPALSALHSLSGTRRINIIWMVRCPHMLEFFLKWIKPSDDGWFLIFYTGKVDIDEKYEQLKTNIKVVKKRPNLEDVITNIIFGIETGLGLPEKHVKTTRNEILASLKKKIMDLDNLGMTTTQKLMELMRHASHYGFELSPLMQEIDEESEESVSKTPEEIFFDIVEEVADLPSIRSEESIRSLNIGVNVDSDSDDDSDEEEEEEANLKRRLNEYRARSKRSLGHRGVSMRSFGGYAETIKEDGEEEDEEAPRPVTYRLNSLGESHEVENDEEMGLDEKPQDEPIKKKTAIVAPLATERRRSSFTLQRITSMRILNPVEGVTSEGIEEIRKSMTHGGRNSLLSQASVSVLDPSVLSEERAHNYVKDLLATEEGQNVLQSWGILYCGGNAFINKNLKEISRKYHIDLNTECFKW